MVTITNNKITNSQFDELMDCLEPGHLEAVKARQILQAHKLPREKLVRFAQTACLPVHSRIVQTLISTQKITKLDSLKIASALKEKVGNNSVSLLWRAQIRKWVESDSVADSLLTKLRECAKNPALLNEETSGAIGTQLLILCMARLSLPISVWSELLSISVALGKKPWAQALMQQIRPEELTHVEVCGFIVQLLIRLRAVREKREKPLNASLTLAYVMTATFCKNRKVRSHCKEFLEKFVADYRSAFSTPDDLAFIDLIQKLCQ